MSDYFKTDAYLEYLRRNFGVAGYDFEEGDKSVTRPDDTVFLEYLELLKIRANDKVLEVGSGLGRLLRVIHDKYGLRPYGVDVFQKVVDEARARVGDICSQLKVCSAESLDFPNDFFDKVICWGVFDLTDQTRSLVEMARVTRQNGLLLITGKNDEYCDDDLEAHEAEVASRRKGISNHFTNFDAMVGLARDLDLDLRLARYFERRGDFAKNLFKDSVPVRFYEFVLVLRKADNARSFTTLPGPIGSAFSKTYLRKKDAALVR